MKIYPIEGGKGKRLQVVVTGSDGVNPRSDTELSFHRGGLDFGGYYDSFVGLEGGRLTWAQIDAIRAELMKVKRD